MIFKQWEQVLDGTKTQTRRPVKPGETYNEWFTAEDGVRWGEVLVRDERAASGLRRKWAVGNTYAVQPARNKPAVGRIRITAIRQARLHDIRYDDVVAEAVDWDMCPEARDKGLTGRELYFAVWNTLYTKPGTRWQDNPPVWVLEFIREKAQS